MQEDNSHSQVALITCTCALTDYLENEDENSTDWSWKLKIDFP